MCSGKVYLSDNLANGQICTAWGPNLRIWILFGYNFNFAVILKFGDSKISIPCML